MVLKPFSKSYGLNSSYVIFLTILTRIKIIVVSPQTGDCWTFFVPEEEVI